MSTFGKQSVKLGPEKKDAGLACAAAAMAQELLTLIDYAASSSGVFKNVDFIDLVRLGRQLLVAEAGRRQVLIFSLTDDQLRAPDSSGVFWDGPSDVSPILHPAMSRVPG